MYKSPWNDGVRLNTVQPEIKIHDNDILYKVSVLTSKFRLGIEFMARTFDTTSINDYQLSRYIPISATRGSISPISDLSKKVCLCYQIHLYQIQFTIDIDTSTRKKIVYVTFLICGFYINWSWPSKAYKPTYCDENKQGNRAKLHLKRTFDRRYPASISRMFH